MNDVEKLHQIIKLINNQKTTINRLEFNCSSNVFFEILSNLRESFKSFLLHISNEHKAYEFCDLFILYYKQNKKDIDFKIIFNFSPSSKEPSLYRCIPFIIDLMNKYEYKLNECVYYMDEKPNYLNYLFNTRRNHMIFHMIT